MELDDQTTRSNFLFTGIKDVDREILLRVNNITLLIHSCSVNNYSISLCNENFWKSKFIRNFGVDLGKYRDKSYLEIYKDFLSPKTKSDDEIWELSIEKGYLPLIKKWVESKDINIHLYYDWSVRLSAEKGHLEVLKYLVSIGADIHAYDDYAVRLAAFNGHLEIVKYLINNGANYKLIKNPSKDILKLFPKKY